MQPENWEKIEEIFNRAVLLSPEEQLRFVEESTSGDRQTRDYVLELLASDRSGDFFLDEDALTLGSLVLISREDEKLLEKGVFAHYRLIRVLGRGGMGVVFLAEDEFLERKVAVKMLPAFFAENGALQNRFKREAKIAAAISHPNIAHIYEAGEFDSQPYIAMEYVEGRTLRRHLTETPKLPASEALEIAAQIASALAAAHRAGIVHRDVKPENIMIREDRLVKVLDFGIAKLGITADELIGELHVSPGENTTEHGMILGTIRYMSPEQLRGGGIDRRTDLWSLGAVLFEMLAGAPPFEAADKNDLIVSILKHDPPAARLSAISNDLKKLLRRALAKDPAQRFQTADEMHAEIVRLLNKTPRRTAASPGAYLRSIRLKLAAAALFLAAILSGVFYFFLRPEPDFAERSAFSALPRQLSFTHLEIDGRVLCAALSPDGKQTAYAVDSAGRQSIRVYKSETGETVEIAAPAPENDFEAVCMTFSPAGDFIYYGVYENDSLVGRLYRAPTGGGGGREMILEGIDSPVSFSPDGKRMAFLETTGNEERLIIADTDGGKRQTIVERADPLFLPNDCHPSWSPDGRFIAFAEGTSAGQKKVHLAIYDTQTGSVSNLSNEDFFDVRQIAWLTGGNELIFTARRVGDTASQLYLAAHPSGEIVRLVKDTYDYAGVSRAANSDKILTVANEDVAQIWIADAEGSSAARQISHGRNDSQGVAWLSNDALVFGSNEAGSWDLFTIGADGSERRQLIDDEFADTDPAASSDGGFVVFSSTRGGVHHLWRLNLADNSMVQLTKGTGEFYPRVSPDDRWVVFHRFISGAPVAVWKVPADGGEPAQLSAKPSARADVSPDGRLVASTYRETDDAAFSIGIYSIDGAARVKKLKPLAGARLFVPLRWSPDGGAVVYVVGKDGADNLWSHPIDGKTAPRRITDFTADRIYGFDFSPDGTRVALARGSRASRAVLIEGVR